LAELVVGEATAAPLASAFFALCAQTEPCSEPAKAVLKIIKRDVDEAVHFRNDVAHGDWWIGWGAEGQMSPPSLWRVKPRRKEGSLVMKTLSADDLDAKASDLVELRNLVGEIGSICFRRACTTPGARIFDHPQAIKEVFTIRDGHVIRQGPSAEGQ
jgi:hypothetical protein